jgi:hypothetical protein
MAIGKAGSHCFKGLAFGYVSETELPQPFNKSLSRVFRWRLRVSLTQRIGRRRSALG